MEREEIYKERIRIEEFGVDEKNTLNNALFDVLFNIDDVSIRSDIENYILGLFNDAYYICTLILLEKRPYFKIKHYINIIGTDKNSIISYDANKVIIVMSMVYDYLKTLDFITFDIDKTTNVIRSEISVYDGNVFETLSSVIERKKWSTKAYKFYPLNYPKDEQCSDYWKNYQNFPNEMSSYIKTHIVTCVEENNVLEEEVRKICNDYKRMIEQDKSIKKLETKIQTYKEQNDSLQSELSLTRKEHTDVVSKYEKRIEELQKDLQTYKEKENLKKQPPQLLLTNISDFARVVQAMVSAHYFKRANGKEAKATEVGAMLLKKFGVNNSWKSVLQKAFSRDNPLKTYDDLRDAGQKYWDERFGITNEKKKKGEK